MEFSQFSILTLTNKQSRCTCLRVNMGCALAIVFQVRSLYVPNMERLPFMEPVSRSPYSLDYTHKSARSTLALKLSVTTSFINGWRPQQINLQNFCGIRIQTQSQYTITINFLSPVATLLWKGYIGLPFIRQSVRPSDCPYGFNNFKSFGQNFTISHTGLLLDQFFATIE